MTEKITLTTREIVGLFNGLSALDGYECIVKDGQRERAVRENYRLGGGLRLVIAKNLHHLRAVVDPYQQARNALVREMANGTDEIATKDMPEFLRREAEMLDAKHDVALVKIRANELHLGSEPNENPIPGSVLAALMPVLDDA